MTALIWERRGKPKRGSTASLEKGKWMGIEFSRTKGTVFN